MLSRRIFSTSREEENVGKNLPIKSTLAEGDFSKMNSSLKISNKNPIAFSLLINKKDHRIKHQMNKISFYSFTYFLLLIMIIPIISVKNATRNLDATSKITIKIDEKGIQEIFSVNYTGGYPNRVYVNDQPITLIERRKVNLTGRNNRIRIEWDYSVANASTMFYSLTNITEVDLSGMNTAQLKNMSRMFAK